MGSPPRLFERQRPLHDIFGGGFVADVILWRRRNVTIGILVGLLAALVVFEISGYTPLSLVSNVLLLLLSILFVWAKSASILNRPPPPLPEIYLSEDAVNAAATFVRSKVNTVLSNSHRIALGKDTKLFFRVASCLWLISIFGSLTDFLTLCYTSFFIVLTIPVVYEKYEDHIDNYVLMVYMDVQRGCEASTKCFNKVKQWFLEEKRKLR